MAIACSWNKSSRGDLSYLLSMGETVGKSRVVASCPGGGDEGNVPASDSCFDLFALRLFEENQFTGKVSPGRPTGGPAAGRDRNQGGNTGGPRADRDRRISGKDVDKGTGRHAKASSRAASHVGG